MTDPKPEINSGNDGIAQHAAAEPIPSPELGFEALPESEPIEADLQPRPEPVLDAAKLAGLVAALVVAVLGIIALVVAGNVMGNLDALSNAVSAIIVAVSALAAYLTPVWQARKAREKVTPLADPRDTLGRKLTAR